jgi:hypothetical protein
MVISGRRQTTRSNYARLRDMTELVTELSEWVRSLGPSHGFQVFGDVRLVKERPWATVVTADTSIGRIFAKANCQGLNAEGPLLSLLAAWSPDDVMAPLAVHPTAGWLVVPDGGETLLAAGRHTDPAAWAPVLNHVASAQRAAIGKEEQLLAAGVPDFRPHTVTARLEQLIDDLNLAGSERRRVLAMVSKVGEIACRLGSDGIGVGISHGDLQPNNLLVPPASKPFDWGDAVVAHPFCTLTILRWSINDEHLHEVVREGYLLNWTDIADTTELRHVAQCAELVGCVAAIWTWVRVGRAGIDLHPASIPTWFDRIELGLRSFGH